MASRNGRNCATRSIPSSLALADSVSRASSGSASSATSDPNDDTVEAAHSRRKLRLDQADARSAITTVMFKEVMSNQ